MFDIHTHLYWKSYDADRDAVIQRALDAGVKKMFVIGCTVEESRQSWALAEKYSTLYASVGIHPHEFNVGGSVQHDTEFSFLSDLRELIRTSNKVVAIGECGLDYYSHDKTREISNEEKELQKKGFEWQLELALEKNLPVIVHCRPSLAGADAYEEMFKVMERYPDIPAFILHCYMGDTEVTKKFLSLPNAYFSFTGNITYPIKKSLVGTKDDLTETVKLVPLDRIFTETDCPFLSPQSKRGERNEPSFVNDVAAFIALLHGTEVKEIENATEENFIKVFPKL